MSQLDPGQGSRPEDRPPTPGPGHLDSVWGGVRWGGRGSPVSTPTPWGISGVFYCFILAETVPSLPPQRAWKACPRAQRDSKFWGQSGLKQRAHLHPAACPHRLQRRAINNTLYLQASVSLLLPGGRDSAPGQVTRPAPARHPPPHTCSHEAGVRTPVTGPGGNRRGSSGLGLRPRAPGSARVLHMAPAILLDQEPGGGDGASAGLSR